MLRSDVDTLTDISTYSIGQYYLRPWNFIDLTTDSHIRLTMINTFD